MELLAEEIVEEWLNWQGYFTIRGIRLGVHEIDLLAVKISDQGIDCRHIGDFSKWQDEPKYQKTFERLLRDLKAGSVSDGE